MDFGTKRGVSEAIKPEPDVKRPKIKMEENDGYSNLSSIPMALPARIKPERTKSESKSEIKLESVPASVAVCSFSDPVHLQPSSPGDQVYLYLDDTTHAIPITCSSHYTCNRVRTLTLFNAGFNRLHRRKL